MLVHFCNAAAAKETAPLAIAIAAADTAGSNACASGAAETATTDIGLALLSRPRSAAGLIARSRIRDALGMLRGSTRDQSPDRAARIAAFVLGPASPST